MTTYRGADIFDGTRLLTGHALRIEDGRVTAIARDLPPSPDDRRISGTLAPGFVDLQVNGGGGILLGDDPSVAGLRRIAAGHRALGTAFLLPTLITDRPDVTRAAIAATLAAIEEGIPGIAGLHLEGPHLSLARKGAHDGALIRPMEAADLAELCEAARSLPRLLVTVAPESVSPDQISALTAAGAIVSLGHTDASYETCKTAFAAGAYMATHLFNAMSPLTSRAPGCVGATLDTGCVSAGLIADGHHVDPATMRLALRAKDGPGGMFLVSDAMAPAGTDMTSFMLGGRRVLRQDGRLTLEDGTLAGADVTLLRSVSVMIHRVGLAPEQALAMATSGPAEHIQAAVQAGRLAPGTPARDILHITSDWSAARWLSDVSDTQLLV